MRRGKTAQPKVLNLYLFCEGKTEVNYFKEIIVKLGLSRVIHPVTPVIQSDPERLLEDALAWIKEQGSLLRPSPRVDARFWLVCDDDGRAEAIARFRAAVKRRSADIQACRLECAWMAPCFEVWPLLHLLPPSEVPSQQAKAQRKLAELMPKYKHDRNATVDCSGKIVAVDVIHGAIKAACDWERTFGEFPDCIGHAQRYAGVHRLMTQLLAYL